MGRLPGFSSVVAWNEILAMGLCVGWVGGWWLVGGGGGFGCAIKIECMCAQTVKLSTCMTNTDTYVNNFI